MSATNRLVLAFDTATDECALALGSDEGAEISLVDGADFRAPRAALGRLLPATEDLLARNGASMQSVMAVIVGLGPGSFTGVRIGVSTAKGLAHGLSAPLYGVCTLDAIAMRFRGTHGLVGVVGDAMRGEVYPRMYRVEGEDVQAIEPLSVAEPDQVARSWAQSYPTEEMILTGNGLAKHLEVFEDALGARVRIASESEWTPIGAGLLSAFARSRAMGESQSGDPGALLPIYTRLSDAEETERQRAGLPATNPPSSGVASPDHAQGSGRDSAEDEPR